MSLLFVLAAATFSYLSGSGSAESCGLNQKSGAPETDLDTCTDDAENYDEFSTLQVLMEHHSFGSKSNSTREDSTSVQHGLHREDSSRQAGRAENISRPGRAETRRLPRVIALSAVGQTTRHGVRSQTKGASRSSVDPVQEATTFFNYFSNFLDQIGLYAVFRMVGHTVTKIVTVIIGVLCCCCPDRKATRRWIQN
mmetsp:Transcript_95175/g.168173  ORF Transcript_95175/g.168173 Transcript_95175/m.168173 type:complete len:196 (+) Transcript_95175:143-730(+)